MIASQRLVNPIRTLSARHLSTDPTRIIPHPCLTFESNTQLRRLIKSNRLLDARRLFDEMPHRDEVSFTTLISGYVAAAEAPSALALFSLMHAENPIPDPFALSVALKAAAASPALLHLGESLHALALKSSALPSSVFVGSALLHFYSVADLDPALKVFDEMPVRNVVSWTAAVSALARAGRCRESLSLFVEMRASGVPYDSHTYAVALKACADAGLLAQGREVHAHAAKLGLDAPTFVANSLAAMYCKCGYLDRALILFEKMRAPDVVSWTTVISNYIQLGREDDAVRLFARMRSHPSGINPNEYTFAAVAGIADVTWGEEIHAHVTRKGFASAMSVGNALVTMYSRAGNIVSADAVFREMAVRDVVSWTAIISAYSRAGQAEETFALFLEMRRRGGCRGNEYTVASLLSACAGAAALCEGWQVHAHALAAGTAADAGVASAVVTMYSKCGCIEEARRAFGEAGRDDVVTWTAMINGYAEHGRSLEAMEMFDRMASEGLRPDRVTYIGALTACAHGGMVERGVQCFEGMREEEAGREHYGCLVDLLGRAGRVGEAEGVIEGMAEGEADEVVWTALLRACGARGEVERGRRAAGRVMELDPGCAGAHVAVSNMYATKGRWGEAGEARQAMRDKGVRKEVGWSSVTKGDSGKGNEVFVAGERSHPRGEELYGMLELMDYGAKMAGIEQEESDRWSEYEMVA